jgi:hypothetical protein
MDRTPARGVPALPAPKAPAGTTLAAMRERGLTWTGKAIVAVPSTGVMLPASDMPGDEAAAYITDGDDLRRLVAEGYYTLGPVPKADPPPKAAPVRPPPPTPPAPVTVAEGDPDA